MDLRMNCLPLLWFEVDGEVFFLAWWLYLAHTLVRKWLRLRRSSEEKNRKQSNLVYVSFTLWLSKSVMLYCCQWLDVKCGLALWFVLMLQGIFLVAGMGCCLEFWRLQLCTLSLLISVIFTKIIKQFFPKKITKMQVLLISFINLPW